ncbi:response regulator, partial [Salmonella enterica]|uniref:response regulator n=1 Tax=Salmonella enterica TaxID=28901 RepID=UPI003CF81B4C
EDEPSIAELLRFTMQGAGFATTIATDVAQARKLIAESLPHVVLLDWMLPDSSGLVLLSKLRRDQRTAALPVIMLTASSDETDRVVGLELGADDYIAKPYSPRELLARIKVHDP